MALTSATMMKLASDPAVRNLARQAALGTVKALGKSRARRAAKGKWYAGRKLGIPPNLQTVQTQPAAYNTQISSNAGTITLSKRERCGVTLNSEHGDNGAMYNWAISPIEGPLFPIMSQSAPSYSAFRFRKLEFEYVPRVGTTANGNVYMAFDPQIHYSDGDFSNVDIIANLPRCTTSSIRQGAKLSIPCVNRDLFIAAPSGAPYDPLNYFNGQFVLAIQGDDADDVGDLYVNYQLTMIKPKITAESQTTCLDLVADVIVNRGRHGIRKVDSHEYTLHSVRPVFGLVIAHGDFVANPISLALNGTVISSPYGFGNGSDRLFIAYELPAMRQGDVLTFTGWGEADFAKMWFVDSAGSLPTV